MILMVVRSSILMISLAKAALLLDTQHHGAIEKIRRLEDTSRYQRKEDVEIEVKDAPRFVVPLNGPTALVEGQSAHYECRIEPYPDNSLRLEWYHNNNLLQTGEWMRVHSILLLRIRIDAGNMIAGHRFRTTYDFGFASLDILTMYGEDSGTYTCKAVNKVGQAVSAVNINVKRKSLTLERMSRDYNYLFGLQPFSIYFQPVHRSSKILSITELCPRFNIWKTTLDTRKQRPTIPSSLKCRNSEDH